MMRYISGTIRAVAVFSGLLLMMCECEDLQRQVTVLAIGLILFIAGILPSIAGRRAKCVNIGYVRNAGRILISEKSVTATKSGHRKK